MRIIGNRTRSDIRGVHLVSPGFSLLAFLSGMFVAYSEQRLGFLVFCAVATLIVTVLLAYLLVKLHRQRQHDSTASEEP